MSQKAKTNQMIALMLLLTACGSESTPNDSEIAPVPAPPPPATFEDVSANSTAVAANATAQSAYTNAVNARERAREAASKGTAVARATDRVIEIRGTEVAAEATATIIAIRTTAEASFMQATLEANQINQQGTAQAQVISLQATQQTQAMNAQTTQVAVIATGTAIAMLRQQEIAAADWENNIVTPAKKMGIVLVIGLSVAALAFFGVRLIDALILRVRIIRDPSGHAIVIPKPDKQGRQTVLLPNRVPGPVLQLAPPQVQPQQVSVDGADADVTQRAQVIEAMSITQHQVQRQPVQRLLGDAVIVPQLGSLTQQPVVRLVPAEQLPPAQIADGHAIEAIDADWRRADE
jgi:hypothetical protein